MKAKKGRKEWDASYMEQEQEIQNSMEDGEEYVRCLDKDSFDGTCYDPEKVITNYGRVWSLHSKHFIKGSQNDHGYLRVTTTEAAAEYNYARTMTIHKLVANYFCDRQIIEIMEAVNEKYAEPTFDLSLDRNGNYKILEVHHMDGDNKNNRSDNLQYIYKRIHTLLTALRNSDSTDPVVNKRCNTMIQELNLDINDPYIKLIYENASISGSYLYGYIIKDENTKKGYRCRIGVKATATGTLKGTEEDWVLEHMKMKAATMRDPDYKG